VSCTMSVALLYTAPARTEIYTLSYTTLFRSGQLSEGGRPLEVPAFKSSGSMQVIMPKVDNKVLQEKALADREQSPKLKPLQFARSEEHTSELQSRENLVCRLLLEKKKTDKRT